MENETQKPVQNRSAIRRVYDILAGFHLATATLLLLLVLTWLATLEQIDAGLYPTLTKYFSWKSPYLIPELNGKTVPIILPGGYYVSALLLVNMTLGGIIRIRKGWRQAGNLISHFGIIFMLLGGGVAHHFSERGNMAIYEGETSDVAEDYHEYVVEVAEAKEGGAEEIHVIRGRFLEGLKAGKPREFRFPDVPFSLEISGYLGNCQPESKLINAPRNRELVADGYYLREMDSYVETERNVAGCYARVVKADGSKSDPFILWGGQFHPFTVNVDGKNFTIDMRKRLWPMPFEVKLDKFTADFHPGTLRPAKFISDVRRVENNGESKVTISMNEPLRHGGLTFFQTSYGPQQPGGGLIPGAEIYSVFEIVRNPADHWPEYSLYVVAFGMLVTFLTKLGGHLGAASRKRKNAA
jgi:hypothetical protein